MCLRVDAWTTVPNGIGSLTSLEELSKLSINSSMDIIEDMGHLTKLRVLNVDFLAEWNESIKNSLVQSLSKLQKLQSIDISIFGECNLDACVVPRRLCRFAAPTRRLGYWFSNLPYWMNPSLLHLAFLSITLRELQQKDLEILGRLPALRNLDLEVGEDIGIRGRLFFTCSSFPCLIQCELHGFIGPVVFQKKTMPKLTNLRYMFPVREIAGINGYFDLGLINLPSLKNVTVGSGQEEQATKRSRKRPLC
ncbi:hypothetical protein PR202_gb13438 [Eleusine coracana subsp. coracana]|uniref:Disease resistance R13L4/SHOC-2-like LRR domain-containing protein n=1 Tax=Eleusine coracana subsp. coracana TaxID=191504 RepID=A0AAV5ES28_ELECO|nr:hypothetical protein PR202_gb13438 [Eleusine coracana subsp. coracana]